MCYKSQSWMDYLIKSKEMFDKKKIKITNTNDKEVILIEPIDKSIMCEYVIKNVMYFLHKDWNLTIMHGNTNKDFFENLVKELGNIKLINLNIDNFTPFPYAYNKFLTNKNFYNLVEKETFLHIQLDVLLFKNIPEKFLKYTYVGAPWFDNRYNVPCGNGGLSIRKKKDMLTIIENFTWGGYNDRDNEDVWLCKKAKILNLNLCPSEEAQLFSSETIYNKNSCGTHKPWFNEDRLKIMIKNVVW